MASSVASPSPSPALPPPPGVTPNFINPDTQWTENAVTQSICVTLAGITFFLRIYARLRLGKRDWNLEDWMVCLSFAGLLCESVIISYIVNHGGGIHQWNLTVPQVQRILYLFWIGSIIYGPFIYFAKVSILMMYLRIFCPRRYSFMWWAIWILNVASGMFYLAGTFVKIWQCEPREKIWNKSVPGKCINVSTVLSASGFFNTISDVLILLIPIKSVWKLKMSVRKKVGACMVLTLGAVAPVFSAIGFYVRVKTATSKDATYNLPLIQYWGTAEMAIAVMCACLPAIPAIFRAKFGRSDTAHSSRYETGTGQSASVARNRRDSLADKSTPRNGVTEHFELENGNMSDDDVSGRSQSKSDESLHLDGGNGAVFMSEVKGGGPGDSDERLVWPRMSQIGADGIVRTVEIKQSDNMHGSDLPHAI